LIAPPDNEKHFHVPNRRRENFPVAPVYFAAFEGFFFYYPGMIFYLSGQAALVEVFT